MVMIILNIFLAFVIEAFVLQLELDRLEFEDVRHAYIYFLGCFGVQQDLITQILFLFLLLILPS